MKKLLIAALLLSSVQAMAGFCMPDDYPCIQARAAEEMVRLQQQQMANSMGRH